MASNSTDATADTTVPQPLPSQGRLITVPSQGRLITVL
jgi:hypothetical protein